MRTSHAPAACFHSFRSKQQKLSVLKSNQQQIIGGSVDLFVKGSFTPHF